MNLDKFFNQKIADLNFVFRPMNLEKIQLGRLMAFEMSKGEDGVQLSTSENIQAELGYSIEEFYLDLVVKDFLDVETFSKIINEFKTQTKSLKSDLTGEFQFIDKRGDVRWGYVYINIRYNKMDWKSISGYILDVTKRKSEEFINHKDSKFESINSYIKNKIEIEVEKRVEADKIIEAQKRHSAVLDTVEKVAHQWRQPLNVISLLMQDLYFKINLGTLFPPDVSSEEIKEIFSEKYNDTYDKVNSHIQYLSDTVDDFRKHLNTNQNDSFEFFNIKDFFKEIIEFVSPSFEKENIEIIDLIKLDFIEINGVENSLKQIVLNIFHNAQDIFRERDIKDRKITLHTYILEEQLHITISDNAGGISPEILPRIFDPYFTTRHETQGTGLGLYMSRELLYKSFHGEMFATNRDDCKNREMCFSIDENCKGVCFTIVIPQYRES